MQQPQVYCYQRCSTCRKAEAWLQQHDVSYVRYEIVATPPTASQFEQWFAAGGRTVKSFFNTSGQKYRQLNLKDKLPTMSPHDAAKLLAEDGMLIKRPLVIAGDVVLSGFSPEKYAKYLLK